MWKQGICPISKKAGDHLCQDYSFLCILAVYSRIYTVTEILICGKQFLRTDEKYFKSHECSQSLFNDGNDNAVSRLIKVHKSLGQFLFIKSNSSVYSIFSIYWLISDLIPKKPKSIHHMLSGAFQTFKLKSWTSLHLVNFPSVIRVQYK